MSRPYSPHGVLRHLPLPLVRQFLAAQDIPAGPGWDALVDGDSAALYRAYLDLPPADRDRVEGMLRQVHEVATPAGVRALAAEALARRHEEAADALAAVDGHHAQALWVLLAHAPAFHTARLLLSVRPGGRYWNLTAGFPGRPPDDGPGAVLGLRNAVAHLYRTEQGRGHRCSVEPYTRGGALYLFVFLDDYAQTHVAHTPQGRLGRTPLRPAFEVVYVYTAAAGTLELYAHGTRAWRAALRDLFCQHVLGCQPPPAPGGRRAYELGGLLDPGFPLAVDPAAGEERATVRRLRVGFRRGGRRVTLEADPQAGPWDVYDMLDAHFPADRFPRADLVVVQAAFTVSYRDAGGRGRSVTFDVTVPDGCTLRSLPDEHRAVGERCLRRWGIVLHEPADEPLVRGRVA